MYSPCVMCKILSAAVFDVTFTSALLTFAYSVRQSVFNLVSRDIACTRAFCGMNSPFFLTLEECRFSGSRLMRVSVLLHVRTIVILHCLRKRSPRSRIVIRDTVGGWGNVLLYPTGTITLYSGFTIASLSALKMAKVCPPGAGLFAKNGKGGAAGGKLRRAVRPLFSREVVSLAFMVKDAFKPAKWKLWRGPNFLKLPPPPRPTGSTVPMN